MGLPSLVLVFNPSKALGKVATRFGGPFGFRSLSPLSFFLSLIGSSSLKRLVPRGVGAKNTSIRGSIINLVTCASNGGGSAFKEPETSEAKMRKSSRSAFNSDVMEGA